MKAIVAAPLLLVASTLGCHQCEPNSDATSRSPDSGAFPEVWWIDPAVLEATFPPKWKLGDTWRVVEDSGKTIHPRGRRTWAFVYRVTAVPDEDSREYSVAVRPEVSYPTEVHVYTFREKPFSLAKIVTISERHDYRFEDARNEARPFAEEFLHAPAAFPIEISARVSDTVTAYPDVVQTVQAFPDGIQFVLHGMGWHQGRVTIVWRPGAPWWSSMRFRIIEGGGAEPAELHRGETISALAP